MNVLLVKCHKRTLYSKIEPIVTEPLELEYLATVLDKLKTPYKIYDSLIDKEGFEKAFNSYKPEVLVLSGYITAVDIIKEYSKYAKEKSSAIKVIVGGVHAEVNYEDFFTETIDIVVHSDGIRVFEKIIKSQFKMDEIININGIAFKLNDKWKVNSTIRTNIEKMPLPNRSYFKKNFIKTKYLHYSPVAILKTALSCPFNCNFCYCRKLNMETYAERPIYSVIEEIIGIDSQYIWIVDDSFLINRNRVLDFINEVKKRKINKKFIAYSRVDFITKNEDIIQRLAEIGFVELIVGMESVDNKKLEDFNKAASIDENMKTVKILKDNGINLTALFIAGIDFTVKDFRNMRKWIRNMKLKSYTVSIFTPIKGTKVYSKFENRVITKDYSKWDLLHLTLKPTNMNSIHFYFQFYLIYIQLIFSSSYIRSFMFKTLKNILKIGGHND